MRTMCPLLVFIITISWQLTVAGEIPVADGEATPEQASRAVMVENALMPSTMRVGRYLADEQRLLDAYCSPAQDTVVVIWEVRAADEKWTCTIGSFELKVDHEVDKGYPQFRRLIIALPQGEQADFLDLVMRKPHLEAMSSPIVNYTTLDIK